MEVWPIIKGAATFIPGLYRADRGKTGGTSSARYCYGVWLRHLALLDSCGLPTHFETVAELGPGDSLGISLAAMLTGTTAIHALDVVHYAHAEANEQILGELTALLARREPIPGADEFPSVHPRPVISGFPAFLSEERLARALEPDRVRRVAQALRGNPSDVSLRYYVPWPQAWSGSASVDLVLSQAVLEHVEDIETVHRLLAAGLRPGGVVSHVIDFRSHRLTSGWDGHLQYGDGLWRLVKGARPYLLNRRSPSEHLEAMRAAGLELVKVERVQASPTVPDRDLGVRFRNWSPEDRSTATMIVTARKVG